MCPADWSVGGGVRARHLTQNEASRAVLVLFCLEAACLQGEHVPRQFKVWKGRFSASSAGAP